MGPGITRSTQLPGDLRFKKFNLENYHENYHENCRCPRQDFGSAECVTHDTSNYRSDLPQFLAKEGGAMWFSLAPHQIANLDTLKYTRFLQHRQANFTAN